MPKLIRKFMVLAAVAWLLPSCGSSNAPKGPVPVGTLEVNGPSVSGNVDVGSVRIFTLSNILANNTYLLRTVIAPGGTLSASIYSSFAAYEAGEPPVKGGRAEAVVPDFYEASFQATVSGDYVVVFSGTPSSTAFTALYFYQLRLMSATGSHLKSFTTSTFPSIVAMATGTIYPDRLHVYSDTTSPIITEGTYTVQLTSSTVPLSHPQMFVFENDSLSLRKLLYSAISASNELTHNREFLISTFSTVTPSTFPTSTYFSTSCTISGVTFISGSPFIQVRGVSQTRYTLSVSH